MTFTQREYLPPHIKAERDDQSKSSEVCRTCKSHAYVGSKRIRVCNKHDHVGTRMSLCGDYRAKTVSALEKANSLFGA